MVPFLDLKAQYLSLKKEIDDAVIAVLDSTQYVLGAKVAEFEKGFARYSNSQETIALNSGTSALHLALAALDIGPGDEVITVPMTFVATVAAICYTGARAILIDVDPITYTMDPARLEAAITPHTKAIIPVHLHGLMADMDPILSIANRHGIPVIEDAAQAHGAEYKSRRAGSVGLMAGFSFYPGKNLGAYGEGGAVTTSDPELAKKIRLLRDWGQDRKYHHVLLGYNYRMDNIQGAILDIKLRKIEEWTERRRAAANRYNLLLAGTGIGLPTEPKGFRHVYHVYSVRIPERDNVADRLTSRGVSTGIHYPVPVHLQPGYSKLGYEKGDFPISESLANDFLSLPMFAELTEEQIESVSSALRDAARA